MVKTKLADSRVYRNYMEITPTSAKKHLEARSLFPSGVTHHARFLRPYPLYVSRTSGSHKWDVDGREYVDYFGGHGALILGHCHPEVVEAVTCQIQRGTHYGSQHELELEWASLIREIVPSAEKIRFTASGTEATLLALRLARAYTGKPKIVRFGAHFHGWHDHVAFSTPAANPPAGILDSIVEQVIIVPPHDLQALKKIFEERDDIAAVILEPTGAQFGHIPINGESLQALRDLTRQHGVLLIFDEVITGFRVSLGGAQEHYRIVPDLTTLAKVVAGGYPGAAVAGRADIFGVMNWLETEEGVIPPLLPHQGTFNANPVSSIAGITTLKLLRAGNYIEGANQRAAAIRDGMNEIVRRRGASWCVYGEFSSFHIFTNPARDAIGREDIYAGKVRWEKLHQGAPLELMHKLRLGFILEGIDINGFPGGIVSGVHDQSDVSATLTAFENVLNVLAEEGDLD